jgi:uncharacterized protein (TIGR02118 family)
MRMKSIRRFELAKVSGTPDGGKAPYYRLADLYFDNMNHLQRVLSSPEGRDTAADLANFATGGVTLLVSDVQTLPSS